MPTAADPRPIPDPELCRSLVALGLVDAAALEAGDIAFEPLTGGVSSDIWKVSVDGRAFCVKRALAKLKVQADWFAPVERNQFEVAWYRAANHYVPGAAPEILAQDEEAMLCVMAYLDPAQYRLWKTELRDGHADPVQAAAVGRNLGRIHAGSVRDETLANQFPRQDIFKAIRLEPYLEATAEKHPDLKDALLGLSTRTAGLQTTLIHGDVSPKNILIGPEGPVFLDAECACIGDPAFDLAFCLNHFLLKCLWTPAAATAFLDCFSAMAGHYLREVDWEDADALEERAASLLAGLFLARIDGKSPVEYITLDRDRDKVRRCARAFLSNPPRRLCDLANAWKKEIMA